ncbi:MAG: VWA domain-containing protein [Gammaproteobacteria bacterium]|nr:VWA domain-containing protein [Gammaproteobacteria bacterium]
MSYSAEISRDNPTGFLFVIDQSGSMEDTTESGRSKAQIVADVLNKTLQTLIISCAKSDGVRSYFDVGVIGYGGAGVGTGFGGALSNRIMHSIKSVSDSPARIEERRKKADDGAGGIVEQKIKFPVWFDPQASGGTPMCAALTKAAEIMVEWCDSHPNSYPPTILHVTDGQSTDGSPESIADGLRQISVRDGQCLLFNLHVTTNGGQEVFFPGMESQAPDEYSKILFRMSNILPPHLSRLARDKGYSVSEGSRGFIYNGDPAAIVDFFEIGTRPKLVADR